MASDEQQVNEILTTVGNAAVTWRIRAEQMERERNAEFEITKALTAQNAALSIEVAMLKAAIERVRDASPYVRVDEQRREITQVAVGADAYVALMGALATPSAAGEHGAAIVAAADAMAAVVERGNALEETIAAAGYRITDAHKREADAVITERSVRIKDYCRLRGAAAASGQGAGEKGE